MVLITLQSIALTTVYKTGSSKMENINNTAYNGRWIKKKKGIRSFFKRASIGILWATQRYWIQRCIGLKHCQVNRGVIVLYKHRMTQVRPLYTR